MWFTYSRMGALSRLTGDRIYENAALRALRELWSMRSSLNLLGTTLDVETGDWLDHSSGIGAGVDSFYEYLIKAHILFRKDDCSLLNLACKNISDMVHGTMKLI